LAFFVTSCRFLAVLGILWRRLSFLGVAWRDVAHFFQNAPSSDSECCESANK
jgi:hypothetical protein